MSFVNTHTKMADFVRSVFTTAESIISSSPPRLEKNDTFQPLIMFGIDNRGMACSCYCNHHY